MKVTAIIVWHTGSTQEAFPPSPQGEIMSSGNWGVRGCPTRGARLVQNLGNIFVKASRVV